MELPEFRGDGDLESFSAQFARWLRFTGAEEAEDIKKIDWWVRAATSDKTRSVPEKLAENSLTFSDFVQKVEKVNPRLENDATIKQKI